MKKVVLVVPILVLLCGCSTKMFKTGFEQTPMLPVAGASDDEIRKLEKLPVPVLIQEGREYSRKGNMGIARLHFLIAIKKDPNSAAAWTGFADIQALTGDLQRAESGYQSALQRLPAYPPALLGLGRLQRSNGTIERALSILQEARQSHPENTQILSELAITMDESGRHEEAEPLHQQVARLHPGSAAAMNNLGFHYLLRERYQDAATALHQAVKLDTRNDMARNNLAVAYVSNGETEKALSLFSNTVGEPAAWNNIGYLLMTKGKREMAEKAFRRALDLDPKFYGLAKKNLDNLGRSEFSQ